MIRRNFLKTGLAGMGTLAVPGTIQALSSTLPSTDKKWAVIYGTKCGSTKDAATWMNEGMGNIATVVDVATTPKLSDYDYVVVGGWISAGNLIANVKSFVSSNKTALQTKTKGLFTLCGNQGKAIAQTQIDTYLTKQIIKVSEITDKPAKLFNGRATQDCGGATYDLLKKEDCVAFGKQIIDAATATILDGSEKSQRFELAHRVNPFSSVATISYSLPRSTAVLLTANALNGRQIATLVSTRQEAGKYSVNWNIGTLAPGIYLYRLEAAGNVETRIARVAGY